MTITTTAQPTAIPIIAAFGKPFFLSSPFTDSGISFLSSVSKPSSSDLSTSTTSSLYEKYIFGFTTPSGQLAAFAFTVFSMSSCLALDDAVGMIDSLIVMFNGFRLERLGAP